MGGGVGGGGGHGRCEQRSEVFVNIPFFFCLGGGGSGWGGGGQVGGVSGWMLTKNLSFCENSKK